MRDAYLFVRELQCPNIENVAKLNIFIGRKELESCKRLRMKAMRRWSSCYSARGRTYGGHHDYLLPPTTTCYNGSTLHPHPSSPQGEVS